MQDLEIFEKNAKDLNTFLNLDLEFTKVYKTKSIPRIKSTEKVSIQNQVDEFIVKIETNQQHIKNEIQVIKANREACEKLKSNINNINYEQSQQSDAQSEPSNRFESLNKHDKELNLLLKYKPSEFSNEIDIVAFRYSIVNPIAENEKKWAFHYLELSAHHGNFDPEKLFESLKNDILYNSNQVLVLTNFLSMSIKR
jgi:vacuolar-type H+-ATPase subunit I/STV1